MEYKVTKNNNVLSNVNMMLSNVNMMLSNIHTMGSKRVKMLKRNIGMLKSLFNSTVKKAQRFLILKSINNSSTYRSILWEPKNYP